MKLLSLAVALLSGSFAAATYREPPDFAAQLKDCISSKDVPASFPGSSNYNELAEPFNLRLQYKPAVIVLPSNNTHVQEAVRCAAQYGYKVQAKSGGHSYASFSSGGQDGSMVINLERFQTVQVNNTTGIAEVGGGVRIGNLAQHIYDQGKRALSHGTCPGVGIGGHFTHGGYGHTSRHWGIALDSIVAAEVVLADGTLVTAYPSGRYKDVFWAIRGAADAIGVVTKFYLKTEAAPADGAITYFSLQWQGVFNGTREDFVKSFLHIQDFATNATVVDDRISFGIYLDGTVFNIGGTFFGTGTEFEDKILPEFLRTLRRPDRMEVTNYDWIGYLTLLSDKDTIVEPVTGYDEHDNFFAKSITVPEKNGLSADSLAAMFNYIKRGSPTPFFVIINLYGGPGSKINAPGKDTNFAAYKHRDSLWVFQLYGYKAKDAPGSGNDSIPFITGLTQSITSAAPGTDFAAYLNYVDPSLSADEAHRLYYGEELYQRLLKVKNNVDPNRVFWNPQAIGA